MKSALVTCLFFCLSFKSVFNFNLDFENDGYYGVLLNAVVNLQCDFNVNSTEDMGDGLTIHWYNSTTGFSMESSLRNAAQEFLASGNFNTTAPWILYTHGYGSSANATQSTNMRNALMNVTNVNIFILDHSNYTTVDANAYTAYQTSVSSVAPIANNVVTYFFDEMTNSGVDPEHIHMIGHSLGAHIIGRIGYLSSQNGRVIDKCVGLDSAGPCFSTGSDEIKLSTGDCTIVEAIHTNQGQLGTDQMITNFDVLLNCVGKVQPYCMAIGTDCYMKTEILQAAAYTTGLVSSCSHSFAVSFYAESVTPTEINVEALECASYDDYKNGNCVQNSSRIAGYNSDSTATYSGLYYLESEGCSCLLD